MSGLFSSGIRSVIALSAVAVTAGALTPAAVAAPAGRAASCRVVPVGAARRPTALPLLPGGTGGAVLGGRGDSVLLGGVDTAVGLRPVAWQRCACGWSVRDLSNGGRIDGNAYSQDVRGDILINTDSGENQAWVRTPDGVAHPLPTPAGYPGGVFARQMNDHGQIAGAVIGPAPDFISTGAVWNDYRSMPRLKNPLPYPASVDSLLLGINDRAATVGNSDNADYSDDVGGEWQPDSADGQILPGLNGNNHSFPLRITDWGMAVGDVVNDDFSAGEAAVWFGPRLLTVGTATSSDTFAAFYGVSQNGRAVGNSEAADGTSSRCIYWRLGDRLRVLLPLAGSWRTGDSNAHYVSNTGLVGGNSLNASASNMPVVWPDADAQAIDP